MGKKFTQEEVEAFFERKGFVLKDLYINTSARLYCVDSRGYEYLVSLSDLRGDRTPMFVWKGNPYSIANIKRYLASEGSSLELLSDVFYGNDKKLLFKCECGAEFETSWGTIYSTKKRYCNFCAKSKRYDNVRDYDAIISDYCDSKNYKLISRGIKRGKDKFEYICLKHEDKGVQVSCYSNMVVSGCGCRYCGNESKGILHRITEDDIRDVVASAGFIYVGYVSVDGIPHKDADVKYICPKHLEKGVQSAKYHVLRHSKGRCVYCVGMRRTKEDLQRELDDEYKDIDILEYTKYLSSITVCCRRCGYIWESMGPYLTRGGRCPKCSTSKFSKKVARLLDDWGYRYQSEYCIEGCRDVKPLPYDYYLTDFDVLIEVDGEQHYFPVRWNSNMSEDDAMSQLLITQSHDEIKDKYCKENGITLIRIPYWEKENLEYFLFDKFVEFGLIEEETVA